MLPSGPEGPSQIMMIGGSDAEDDHYDNPDQTNTTLIVNMANGAITGGPPNIRGRAATCTRPSSPTARCSRTAAARGSPGTAAEYAGPVMTAELLAPGA